MDKLKQLDTFVSVAQRGSLAGAARAYHKNVVDHYERPRNVGSFDKNDPNVGTGLVGAPACGDVMKLQIKVRLAGGHVRVRACVFMHACVSVCVG